MTFCNFILTLQILYVMLTTVIRLQKLAMPATGRRTCGPSFFQNRRSLWAQTFLKWVSAFRYWASSFSDTAWKCRLIFAFRLAQSQDIIEAGARNILAGYPVIIQAFVSRLISTLLKQSPMLPEERLLTAMGFPGGWKSLTRYKEGKLLRLRHGRRGRIRERLKK